MLRWTHPDSSDWLLAPPLFVPESAAQFPGSAAGVVVVLSVAVATGDSALLLLDLQLASPGWETAHRRQPR